MQIDLCNLGLALCKTESDVEQKLLFPLLTAQEWLGFPLSSVHTKEYLPPASIDKGSRRYGYYPDYSVWIDAVPIAIIEAKSPAEAVEEGFREAQLYAHELNRGYPPGLNPVRYVLCTNGRQLRYGDWDSGNAIDISVPNLRMSTAAHSALVDYFGYVNLRQQASRIRARLRPTLSFRPIDRVGGDPILNRRIELNSFAVEIAPLVRMFFESESDERIDDIIQHAYVSSDEITKYDQILEVFLRDNINEVKDFPATQIETTQRKEGQLTPKLRAFGSSLPTNGHLQLIIGPVGSGKSLFCRRYYRYLCPDDVRQRTYWAFLNVNDAKNDLSNFEDWVCEEFIKNFQLENPNLDIFDPEMLARIFAPDINQIKKIFRNSSNGDSNYLKSKIDEEVYNWTKNFVKFARSLCRYLNGDKREVVVVVFDNVDRRDRDQQLQIFQAAQWFRAETRSFCILPLRDETYEQFKTKPPLDAFINAIHFTITPPRFIDVVRKRLEICIEHIASNAPNILTYSLPDGKKITYPANRLGEFLKTLYLDIFQSGRRVSWLLESLAGRNVRLSLRMFTRILMSGHLDERQITGTLLGTVRFSIRDSTIVNVLMKTDYLYFDNSHGFITNILFCNSDWERQSNFLIIELLEYLVSRRKQGSQIGPQGYSKAEVLIGHMERMGFTPADSISALNYMLSEGLITVDHLGKTSLKPDDYISAKAPGFVHARLLMENIHYVSGIAASTFLLDKVTAEQISQLITVNPGYSDVRFGQKKQISYLLLKYLRAEYNRHCSESPFFANQATGARFALRMLETCVNHGSESIGAHLDTTLL